MASLHWRAWDTSALVRMHGTLPIARLAAARRPVVPVAHESGFYDGAFFYAIARDPLATGEAHRLLQRGRRTTGAIPPTAGWRGLRAAAAGPAPSPTRCSRSACSPSSWRAAPRACSRRRSAGRRGAVSSSRSTRVSSSPSTTDTSEPLGAALLLLGLVAYAARPARLGARPPRGAVLREGAPRARAARDRRVGALAHATSAARRRLPSSRRCSGGSTSGSISVRFRSARAASGSLRRSGGGSADCSTRRRNRGTSGVDTAQLGRGRGPADHRRRPRRSSSRASTRCACAMSSIRRSSCSRCSTRASRRTASSIRRISSASSRSW